MRVFLSLALLLALSVSQAATAYKVRPGDTLSGIAARAGVSMARIRAVNPQLRGDTVKLGQTISIPARTLPARSQPVRKYHVQRGENLSSIAQKFGLNTAQLIRANPAYRSGKNVWAGAVLTIPGRASVATKPYKTANRPRPTWLWPVPGYHRVSSGFGSRTLEGNTAVHYGIDIVAPTGTPVVAARSGRVLESRPDFARGWGWTVVLQHPDGWITRYAHLSQNLVKRGEWVRQGQRIGRVGNTGHSTGPHLHYGTYWGTAANWKPRDPLRLY